VVIALLGAAFASVSYALALTLKSEDAFAPLLNAFVLPGAAPVGQSLLPMTLAPGWLQAVSDRQPAQAHRGGHSGVLRRRIRHLDRVVGASC
jgi:ABC-2 type transport system permease protein